MCPVYVQTKLKCARFLPRMLPQTQNLINITTTIQSSPCFLRTLRSRTNACLGLPEENYLNLINKTRAIHAEKTGCRSNISYQQQKKIHINIPTCILLMPLFSPYFSLPTLILSSIYPTHKVYHQAKKNKTTTKVMVIRKNMRFASTLWDHDRAQLLAYIIQLRKLKASPSTFPNLDDSRTQSSYSI